jgi:hypothetical protein
MLHYAHGWRGTALAGANACCAVADLPSLLACASLADRHLCSALVEHLLCGALLPLLTRRNVPTVAARCLAELADSDRVMAMLFAFVMRVGNGDDLASMLCAADDAPIMAEQLRRFLLAHCAT